MSIELMIKTPLINEIGLFTYGKGNWLEYVNKMESCFVDYNIGADEIKKDMCISAIGAKTVKSLKSIIRPKKLQDADVTYEFIIDALENHFYPNRDASFYITKFQLRKQGPHETFFQYVIALRKLLVHCHFAKKSQHSKLRNQLIAGAKEEVKSKFNANSMSLSQVLEVGLLWDDARSLKSAPHPRNHKARKNRVPKCFRCAQPRTMHNNEPCMFDWSTCSGCGTKGHVSLACKYKEMTCNNCKGKGHITKLCKKPTVAPVTVMMTKLSITKEEE